MICLLVEHSHVNMNQSARLTWCVDEDALRIAVANSMFPGESLDETEAQQVTGVVECLLENGIYHFEGDPPIQIIRGEKLIDDATVTRALKAYCSAYNAESNNGPRLSGRSYAGMLSALSSVFTEPSL